MELGYVLDYRNVARSIDLLVFISICRMAGILLFYFIFFFLFLGIVAIYSPLGGSCILLKIQLLYDNVCRVCLFGSCSFKTNFERHSFFFLVGMIFVAG